MPITSQGDREIFDNLNRLQQRVDSPTVVSELAQAASRALAETTPVGRRGNAGLLKRTMTEVAEPVRTAEGWWAGVGNLEGIYPLKSAPRGTIAAFLKRKRKKEGDG